MVSIKKIFRKYKLWIHLLLILGSIVMVLPFVWMLLTSAKTLAESMQIPPVVFPKKIELSSYQRLISKTPFLSYYVNTFLMILGRVCGSVLFSAMAAYAAARLKFPFRNLFFNLVLIQMMIPGQIFIVPQYLLAQKLGLLDSVPALVLPGIVSAFGTFLLRQFFLTLPNELEESARLDGASIWQIFFKIMLPLARSGLIALAIFTALFAYKDLMWPLIVNISADKMTLSAGLAKLQGQFATDFPQLMAGSVLAMWPMVVLFVVFQKKFIDGVTSASGKL